MNAVQICHQKMSLNTALKYCGVSKGTWYYARKDVDRRTRKADSGTVSIIRTIGKKRPTYGTRRMANQILRETGVRVNRKKIQRIYRQIGWIEPKKTKNDIIRASRKLTRPDAPNRLWQADITYVDCGGDGWCYCFNVLDAFSRRWLAYSFDTTAQKENAIQAVLDAVSAADPDCSMLTLRTDNGSQYTSRMFRESLKQLGIRHELIAYRTPEQNGHIESFHGSIKREYLWPHEFDSFQDASDVIREAFRDYNHDRIHSSLGYLTPMEFVVRHQREAGK